ncbi:TetR/AcrR family transcriptional regulator [Methylopila sp. M107]|uniref:TetR/AcrR family transcriptional regulator n=1 Tax=Methylopila sp. M107 TaxID=1101190 RepID=UPI000360AF0A|nr:TetR/AcrR family transcriptional regulator [Methylopila sp. M107]
MPISKARKAQSRERIVAEASALFRRDGIDAVSVPALMRSAGLTHGGFYGHFAGKDDLAAAAILKSLEETAERLVATGETATDPLAAIIRSYVSRAHRDHPEEGCAVAALGPEAARGPERGRRAMVEGVRAIAKSLETAIDPVEPAAAQDDALSLFAGMIGAIVLARACGDDPALSDRVLKVCRERLKREFGGAGPSG